ncbi:MAG: hypothetical protein CFE21_13015 [Bacteroidetes bacterium B1(2017)]|nr:MAG: hypothetical protein CFE21_13015 [Bacteroidetes bacterium B1(2017)]
MKQLDEEESKKQEQLKAYEKNKTGFDPSKLVYGGNVGAAFNTNYSYVLAQPMVGYKVYPKTIAGLGFTYIYQSNNIGGKTYSTSAYGPIVFVRQSLIPQIFLHAEYQPINHQISITERTWTNQLFVGGGLGSSGAQVYVLYDVLHSSQSLYASPWMIRIGFMF